LISTIIAIILILLIIAVAVYIYFVIQLDKHNLIIKEPRRAKLALPVASKLSWMSFQDKMTIKDFQVKIIESRLNLSNHRSLIAYTISGEVETIKGGEYYIQKVHISERLSGDKGADNYPKYAPRILEITPIVAFRNVKKAVVGKKEFSFTNEEKIDSLFWGPNLVTVTCGKWKEELKFNQGK